MTTDTPTQDCDYEVVQAREIDGLWRSVGETIRLSPRRAQYYLPPLGTGLQPVAAKRGRACPEAPAEKAET